MSGAPATGGTYAHPVACGQGVLPYACDLCQAPAVAVRAGGYALPWSDDLEADRCWCAACWSRAFGGSDG